jgi:hypothetical protein
MYFLKIESNGFLIGQQAKDLIEIQNLFLYYGVATKMMQINLVMQLEFGNNMLNHGENKVSV